MMLKIMITKNRYHLVSLVENFDYKYVAHCKRYTSLPITHTGNK